MPRIIVVKINDLQYGLNTPESEIYLRLLNDFRISVENIFLDLIDYLYQFEIISSENLEEQMEYLKFLGERYHKKQICLKIISSKNEDLDKLMKLVQKTRKTIDYCLLDLSDFYHKAPETFTNIRLNKSLSIILKQKLRDYNKILPEKLKKVPQENLKLVNQVNYLKSKTKFPKFSEKIIEIINREFLKMYDYLIETDLHEIKSKSVYTILEDLKKIGADYNKLDFEVKIRNKFPVSSREKFLEENCRNLLRLKELKSYLLREF